MDKISAFLDPLDGQDGKSNSSEPPYNFLLPKSEILILLSKSSFYWYLTLNMIVRKIQIFQER